VYPQDGNGKYFGFPVRCVQDEPIPTTLQAFTSANCSAMNIGSTITVTNNGSGSYTIRKLADNNCYVNMNVQKQWYGSNTATGDCAPSSTGYPACNTCYAINNNGDWFLPSNTQYDALISAAGSGSQLYTALGLGADTYFWSSSEYASSTWYAWGLDVYSSGANTGILTSKPGSNDVLCRRN
jgi:hypothetical protein